MARSIAVAAMFRIFFCVYMLTYADSNEIFSGFYYPNNEYNMESYGAAWLAPKERLLARHKKIRTIRNLEGASIEMVDGIGETNIMTRDYFDFHVCHMSCSTNGIANHTINSFLTDYLDNKLKRTTAILERETSNPVQKADDRLRQKSVAVITFSVASGSSKYEYNQHQEKIRIEYFKATFWSVHRYIPHIVVAIAIKRDIVILKSLNLPVWVVANLTERFDETVPRLHPKSRWHLPKHSLLFLISRLNMGMDYKNKDLTSIVNRNRDFTNKLKTWSQFEYVYYTEADQVMYMRQPKLLMDALDTQNKSLIAVPHRMHTLLLPEVYPELSRFIPKSRKILLSKVNLVTEGQNYATGSCCDNGRYVFENCGNFWYMCKKWVSEYKSRYVMLCIT